MKYVRDLLLRGRRSADDVRPLSAASRSAEDGLTRVVPQLDLSFGLIARYSFWPRAG